MRQEAIGSRPFREGPEVIFETTEVARNVKIVNLASDHKVWRREKLDGAVGKKHILAAKTVAWAVDRKHRDRATRAEGVNERISVSNEWSSNATTPLHWVVRTRHLDGVTRIRLDIRRAGEAAGLAIALGHKCVEAVGSRKRVRWTVRKLTAWQHESCGHRKRSVIVNEALEAACNLIEIRSTTRNRLL